MARKTVKKDSDTAQNDSLSAVEDARFGSPTSKPPRKPKEDQEGVISLSELAVAAGKGAIQGGAAGAAVQAGKTVAAKVAQHPVKSAGKILRGEITNNKTVNKAIQRGMKGTPLGLMGAAARGVHKISGRNKNDPATSAAGITATPSAATAAPQAGGVDTKNPSRGLMAARTGAAPKRTSSSPAPGQANVGGKIHNGDNKKRHKSLILVVVILLLSPVIFMASIAAAIGFLSNNGLFPATQSELTAANSSIPAQWLQWDQQANAKYGVPWPILAGIEYTTTDFGQVSPYTTDTNASHIGGGPSEGYGPMLLSNSVTQYVSNPYSGQDSVDYIAKSLANILAQNGGSNPGSIENDPFNQENQAPLQKAISALPIQVGPCMAAAAVSDGGTGVVPQFPWQCANMQTGTNTKPISIGQLSAPTGTIDVPYTYMLKAKNGVPPYSWSVQSGKLPPGITISGQQLTGVPTQTGSFSFTVKVSDSSVPTPVSASQDVVVTISKASPPPSGGGGTAPCSAGCPTTAPPLSITSATVPSGTAGKSYSTQLSAAGGTKPYTWSLDSSSQPLPSGLKLSSTGTISGTLSCSILNTTIYPLTIKVQDAATPLPSSNTVQLALTVYGAYNSAGCSGAASPSGTSSSGGGSAPSPTTTTTTAATASNYYSGSAATAELLSQVTINSAPSERWPQFSSVVITEAQNLIGDQTCNSAIATSVLTSGAGSTSTGGSRGTPKSVSLTNNWVTDFLSEGGYPVTPQNVEFVQAWIQAETHGWADGISQGQPGVHTPTGDGGKFNPISTTQHMPASSGGVDQTDTVPSTDYGGAGQNGGDPVQNYNSYADGLWANAYTILNPTYYAPLEQALKNGNSAIADATAEAQTPWGTGGLILKILEEGGPSSPLQGTNWLGPNYPPAKYTDGITAQGPSAGAPATGITLGATGSTSACAIQAILTSNNGSLGQAIAQLALSQLGQTNSNGQYGPTGEAWCALFTTWVWGHSGVNIPSIPFTGNIYNWGQATGNTLPPTAQPQVGDAILYGTGPQSTSTSLHVNIVVNVLPNGQVITVGGNEGNSVHQDGPFSVAQSEAAMGMPVYAIVKP